MCGWYSTKKKPNDEATLCISGKVAIWGKVIEHGKDGYRSEYAYPIHLFFDIPMPGFILPPAIDKEFEMFRQNYGCTIGEEDEG